jgi:F-box and leucine-rich repeat protein 2/20
MEDLPEPLIAEIVKRTCTSDRSSLSLVSKRLYKVEADERGVICVGCGLNPATEALSSLCSRFPNLWKVEINYNGWLSNQGAQLDNQGLHVLSSQCPSLTDLTLSFCSYIDDSGLGYLANCKKLIALRLNFVLAISSSGLLLVAVGCKSLSILHLADCMNVSSVATVLAQQEYKQRTRWGPTQQELEYPGNAGVEWLEYLGMAGSLVELVVKDCKGISQYDLLKFGPGWMKLQKFEYEFNGTYWLSGACDNSYNAHYPYQYDFSCKNMKDLRLAKIITEPEIGLRFLLGKCKALEKLCLDYVLGLNEGEMIQLFQSCSNLRSISLRLIPRHGDESVDFHFSTALTDESLKILSLYCPMLQVVEFTFTFCSPEYPSEIGFTQDGIVGLIKSCPIRVLMLNGANNFYDTGMKGLSASQFLERLELVDCGSITDAGIRLITCAPSLRSLTLRKCERVTGRGMAELVCLQKLESLTVVGCPKISEEAVQGAARSVHYSAGMESHDTLKGMNLWKQF